MQSLWVAVWQPAGAELAALITRLQNHDQEMAFAILRGWFRATLQYGAKLLRHGEPGQPAENKDE